jgi:hypothetical protein
MDKDNKDLKFLDPNTNLFILVDDANLNNLSGCEKSFRSKFETKLNESKCGPVIVVNIEGGASIIWSTLKSVEHNIPCIFVNVITFSFSSLKLIRF